MDYSSLQEEGSSCSWGITDQKAHVKNQGGVLIFHAADSDMSRFLGFSNYLG